MNTHGKRDKMAKAIHGMDLVLFFRRLADQETEDASRLRFQTEHTITEEKESESNPTKDGSIVNVTEGENSIDFTSYAYVEDDGTQAMWKVLHEYFQDSDEVEVWEVDTKNPTDEGSYNATYYTGYITSFEKSSPSDGTVELSFTVTLQGAGVEGTDVLTEEQEATVGAKVREYNSLNRTDSPVQ